MEPDGTTRALRTTNAILGAQSMLSIYIDNIGEMAVVECNGSIVGSEAALELRRAVNSQGGSRIIVLDLSEVPAIEGGGLGMLVFLQRSAQDRGVQFKLFNPRQSVRDRLGQVNSIRAFDIATLDEMMALVACNDVRFARAA
jgi:anti-anti-sigma regulatory factor